MTKEEYKGFINLRRQVMNKIKKELSIDNYHKSYEGTFEIELCYPDYFDDKNGKLGPEMYIIRLHCYVLGPNRHYEWHGKTFKEALDRAKEEINEWGDTDE